MDEIAIADLQPYLEATVVGRLGALDRRLTRTTVWLLEDPGAGLPLLRREYDSPARIRLDFRGPRPRLASGKKVRVSGMALPLGPTLRMASPKLETIHTRESVVVLRSSPCSTCGRDGTWVLDWMGFRGQGVRLTGPKTFAACPDCEGTGFRFFLGSGLFALSRWTAGVALAVALALGWVLGH
jgi:hypothetical protein